MEFISAKENPWIKNALSFKGGFWEIEPYSNELFHVTPTLNAILASGELSPRRFRASQGQSLGGVHDISTSFYGNIHQAMSTLMFMYRIWQTYKQPNELPFESIEDYNYFHQELQDTSNDVLDTISTFAKHLNAQNPLVLGNQWVDFTKRSDFAIIEIDNPCRYLFIDDLKFNKSQSRIESLMNSDLVDLREFVGAESDLVGASYFGKYFGNLAKGYTFYSQVRQAMSSGRTSFNFDWEDIFPNYGELLTFGDNHKMQKFKIAKNVYAFKSLTIDLNTQDIPLKQICEFSKDEQEFRLFQEIKHIAFKTIYRIDDVLQLAKELNNGIEPFFWHVDASKGIDMGMSHFSLAAWASQDSLERFKK